MGIFKSECHGIECDNCGKSYESPFTGFSLWINEGDAKEDTQEHEWLIEEGKCYCPDCYEFDDDDNLIIKRINKQSWKEKEK